jgi:hypothetical protein
MDTKPSGLDQLAENFVAEPRKGGRPKGSKDKAPRDPRKGTKIEGVRKLRKALKTDERDPAVVAAQETCGSCGATDHGFNDCPNTGSAATDVLSQELEPVANGEALAARVFFQRRRLARAAQGPEL